MRGVSRYALTHKTLTSTSQHSKTLSYSCATIESHRVKNTTAAYGLTN